MCVRMIYGDLKPCLKENKRMVRLQMGNPCGSTYHSMPLVPERQSRLLIFRLPLEIKICTQMQAERNQDSFLGSNECYLLQEKLQGTANI